MFLFSWAILLPLLARSDDIIYPLFFVDESTVAKAHNFRFSGILDNLECENDLFFCNESVVVLNAKYETYPDEVTIYAQNTFNLCGNLIPDIPDMFDANASHHGSGTCIIPDYNHDNIFGWNVTFFIPFTDPEAAEFAAMDISIVVPKGETWGPKTDYQEIYSKRFEYEFTPFVL